MNEHKLSLNEEWLSSVTGETSEDGKIQEALLGLKAAIDG
jgi:hypothetical protein